MFAKKTLQIIIAALFLAGCGGKSIPQVVGDLITNGTTGIPTPSVGKWVVSSGNVSVNSNGSFTFGTTGGQGQGVGYVYTAHNGSLLGKTITMTYTIGGTGTVMPSAASGLGNAEVRLFLWRAGDNLVCDATTEWFREWSRGSNGAGRLTVGTHTISTVVGPPDIWTDCLGKTASASQLGSETWVGFTFGAEFFGHGVYSTGGQNTFTLNSFTVQ